MATRNISCRSYICPSSLFCLVAVVVISMAVLASFLEYSRLNVTALQFHQEDRVNNIPAVAELQQQKQEEEEKNAAAAGGGGMWMAMDQDSARQVPTGPDPLHHH